MDAVKIDIKIADPVLKPHERIKIHIALTNVSPRPVRFPPALGYVSAFNGEICESTGHLASLENYTSEQIVQPGATLPYSYSQGLELSSILASHGLQRVRFSLTLDSLDWPDFRAEQSEDIQIDFTGFRNLAPEFGEDSEYYASEDTIFHYSRHRGGDRCVATLLKGKVGDYRILTSEFAVSESQVYNRGGLVRGVRAQGFRAFNHVFVGNDELIMTSYGNAKVADPKSFQVLDEGAQPHRFGSTLDNDRGSFARDNQFAYYFDHGTSTPHALRIRGCKDPAKLEAIGHGYARDDKNVFLQSNRLKHARPGTFRLLNRRYTTDGHHVFYHDWIVEGADPASFEVLPSIIWPGDPDGLFESCWARDKNRIYDGGSEGDPAEYTEHLKRDR